MDSPFLPSQVILHVPPLTGTMGHSEIEHAAALIVRVCQALGDTWQPISVAQIAEVIRADVTEKREPFASLVRNPFFSPDIHEAIAKGFAAGDPKGSVELTAKGLEALRRWVRGEGARG